MLKFRIIPDSLKNFGQNNAAKTNVFPVSDEFFKGFYMWFQFG